MNVVHTIWKRRLVHIKRVFMVIGASFRLKESGSAEVSVQIPAIDKSQSAEALLLNGPLKSKEIFFKSLTVVGCYAHLISLCNTIKLQHMVL